MGMLVHQMLHNPAAQFIVGNDDETTNVAGVVVNDLPMNTENAHAVSWGKLLNRVVPDNQLYRLHRLFGQQEVHDNGFTRRNRWRRDARELAAASVSDALEPSGFGCAWSVRVAKHPPLGDLVVLIHTGSFVSAAPSHGGYGASDAEGTDRGSVLAVNTVPGAGA